MPSPVGIGQCPLLDNADTVDLDEDVAVAQIQEDVPENVDLQEGKHLVIFSLMHSHMYVFDMLWH